MINCEGDLRGQSNKKIIGFEILMEFAVEVLNANWLNLGKVSKITFGWWEKNLTVKFKHFTRRLIEQKFPVFSEKVKKN